MTIYVVCGESGLFLFGYPVADLLELTYSLVNGYVFAKQHHATMFDILNSVGVGMGEVVQCRLSVEGQLFYH